MPEAVTKTFDRFLERWKALDRSQKLRWILSIIVIIGSALVATVFIANPTYVKLVSGSVSEVGEMSKQLTEAGILHKVIDNSTTITVKQKDKDTAEITLAQSGLLKDGMKFEDSLNLISFSTTESDKKKIYKEYYEGKLAEKLSKMDSIRSAVVTFSIPDKSVFIGDSEEDAPTASVMITPLGSLTANQVDGIVKIVASSVERLSEKNVTIVDNAGNILNDADDSSLASAGFSNKQLEVQSQKKKEVEKQIALLLADTTDSVKVVANIICDFDQETSESVKYETPIEDSDTGLLRETSLLSEKLQNMDSGMVPGTDSNQGTGAEVVSTGSGGTYQKNETSNSYELNQTNKRTTKGLGNIDPAKSSITVNLLYGTVFTEAPDDEKVENISKMVSTATGIDPDRITVASFKMTPKNEETIEIPIDWAGILQNYAPYIAAIIIILILVIFISKLKGGSGELSAGSLVYGGNKGAIFEAVAAEEGETEGEIKPMDENSEVKKQINKFIEKQPDIAAGMLRNWIYENDKTTPGN